MKKRIEHEQPETLYGHIADELRTAIRAGIYDAGERLPSLRETCTRYRVSLSTAVEAYGQLQDEGWLQPRERSGFFVLVNSPGPLQGPRPVAPPLAPVKVSLGRLAMGIMEDARLPGVCNLGAGIPGPALLPLKRLSRAMSGAARDDPHAMGRVEEIRGEEGLRRQIARLMGEAGVACDPEEIVVTNGCQEALTLALQSVTEPGGTIAVESPTYFGILQAAEALRLKVVEMPLAYPAGLALETVAEVVRRHRISACVLMPSVHNPAGVVMAEQSRARIARLLAAAGVPLVEDDIFGALAFSWPRPKPARAFDASGNTLLCSSFSKTLAPGLRVGWILPGKFFAAVEYRKFLANITTAGLPQQAVARVLAQRSFRRAMRRTTQNLQVRQAQMRADITAHFPEETRLTEPRGGLFLWVELPDRLDATVLYRRALERRISTLPGTLFSAGGEYGHHLRLNYSTAERDAMREGIKGLAALLPELPPLPGAGRGEAGGAGNKKGSRGFRNSLK